MAKITAAERAAVAASKIKTAAQKAKTDKEINKPAQGRTATKRGKYL